VQRDSVIRQRGGLNGGMNEAAFIVTVTLLNGDQVDIILQPDAQLIRDLKHRLCDEHGQNIDDEHGLHTSDGLTVLVRDSNSVADHGSKFTIAPLTRLSTVTSDAGETASASSSMGAPQFDAEPEDLPVAGAHSNTKLVPDI
jgi:hypothetical protein